MSTGVIRDGPGRCVLPGNGQAHNLPPSPDDHEPALDVVVEAQLFQEQAQGDFQRHTLQVQADRGAGRLFDLCEGQHECQAPRRKTAPITVRAKVPHVARNATPAHGPRGSLSAASSAPMTSTTAMRPAIEMRHFRMPPSPGACFDHPATTPPACPP
jgi:hypothetical protein